MLPAKPRSTLFPYTTLFRSRRVPIGGCSHVERHANRPSLVPEPSRPDVDIDSAHRFRGVDRHASSGRSEEHTSELQSRGHLVCRLLLEKKKRLPYRSAVCLL